MLEVTTALIELPRGKNTVTADELIPMAEAKALKIKRERRSAPAAKNLSTA